ncbi:MAG: ABC transporter ATP-binding protein, partial [Verrucomicrobia bacterium]|nr:ABC transporter ATP-binding protein [Verrucomicrobiota bacterium]
MTARKPLTVVDTHDRETDAKPLDMGLIRRLFRYMRPYRRKRNTVILLVIARSLQLPILAWAIGAIIGGPISRLDARGLIVGVAGYALLAIVTQVTLSYRSRLALELGESVVHDLRNELFVYLQSLPMKFFNDTKLGRIISRFTSDAESMRTGIQDVLFVGMVNAGQMIGAAVIMAWLDWVLFLVIAFMAPVLWGANRYFHHRFSRAFRAVQESFSRVTATLAESVTGIRVTQGFARQQINSGLFHELVADHSHYNLDTSRTMGVFLPLLEFNTQLFIAATLMLGGWRVMNGQMAIEDLYQFILLAQIFFGPIQVLGTQYGQAMSAMAGAERVFKMLDTPPDWSDPPNAYTPSTIKGAVEFRNVSFGYDPKTTVLHDINFTVEPGQTIALVGHTGCGKSTITNLISKFYLPTSGEILIDGVDSREIETNSLRRHLGIVSQQNFLFTGTLLDNIRFGNPEALGLEVIMAAQELDCLDLITDLPDGIMTTVGEGGKGLSIGQR